MPGTKPVQIPELSTGASECAYFCQRLKSPITQTRSALGAQTAKWTPSLPPRMVGCEPRQRQRCVWLPSLKRYRSSGVRSDSVASSGFTADLVQAAQHRGDIGGVHYLFE